MHSKTAAGSLELNVKRARRGLKSTGPESIVVSGSTTVNARVASPIGALATSARTRNVYSPGASPV